MNVMALFRRKKKGKTVWLTSGGYCSMEISFMTIDKCAFDSFPQIPLKHPDHWEFPQTIKFTMQLLSKKEIKRGIETCHGLYKRSSTS